MHIHSHTPFFFPHVGNKQQNFLHRFFSHFFSKILVANYSIVNLSFPYFEAWVETEAWLALDSACSPYRSCLSHLSPTCWCSKRTRNQSLYHCLSKSGGSLTTIDTTRQNFRSWVVRSLDLFSFFLYNFTSSFRNPSCFHLTLFLSSLTIWQSSPFSFYVYHGYYFLIFLAGNPLPVRISEQFLTTAFAIATVYTSLAILGLLPSRWALVFSPFIWGEKRRGGEGHASSSPHTKEGEVLPAR